MFFTQGSSKAAGISHWTLPWIVIGLRTGERPTSLRMRRHTIREGWPVRALCGFIIRWWLRLSVMAKCACAHIWWFSGRHFSHTSRAADFHWLADGPHWRFVSIHPRRLLLQGSLIRAEPIARFSPELRGPKNTLST